MNTIKYEEKISTALDSCIEKTSMSKLKKTTGKVRDIYDLGQELLLVTTDRLSAFDRSITTIPFKGQVLNQLSKFWFNKTKHIVSNHMLETPYANTMRVKKYQVFPIEFVVRSYITGSTNTSLWTLYSQGEREFGGVTLDEGLQKNSKLLEPILTPTTKAIAGDKPIEKDEIIALGLMSAKDWHNASAIALQLFDEASNISLKQGLILVDTKFELGKDKNGNIILVDEALTPDSSRYWRLSNFDERIKNGLEPDNFDKELIRLWYKEVCDPYSDKELPKTSDELRVKVAGIYISLYEQMTGEQFNFNEKSFS